MKMLIIEDKVEEVIFARESATKAGLTDIVVVTNLEEALREMPKVDCVASDLFFPAGNLPTDNYSQKFLPKYEDFSRRNFPKLDKDDIVLRAVTVCAQAFGMTPNQYVEDVMAKLNTPVSVLRSARDAVEKIKDYEGYLKFQKVEESIRNGSNLPLGIVVSEEASSRNIPSIIVTSTFHHDYAFEPIRGLVSPPYYDTLVDGHKNWSAGFERLIKLVEEIK